jgi:hypothetical protein
MRCDARGPARHRCGPAQSPRTTPDAGQSNMITASIGGPVPPPSARWREIGYNIPGESAGRARSWIAPRACEGTPRSGHRRSWTVPSRRPHPVDFIRAITTFLRHTGRHRSTCAHLDRICRHRSESGGGPVMAESIRNRARTKAPHHPCSWTKSACNRAVTVCTPDQESMQHIGLEVDQEFLRVRPRFSFSSKSADERLHPCCRASRISIAHLPAIREHGCSKYVPFAHPLRADVALFSGSRTSTGRVGSPSSGRGTAALGCALDMSTRRTSIRVYRRDRGKGLVDPREVRAAPRPLRDKIV